MFSVMYQILRVIALRPVEEDFAYLPKKWAHWVHSYIIYVKLTKKY